MSSQFQTVGIIGRIRNPGVKETLLTLIDYFNKLKQDFIIETETAKVLDLPLPTVARESLSEHCDLLIVIGGDGSLLNAIHAIIQKQTPVLGINRGSLGFLTDIHPHKLTKIKTILEGEFRLEKRFLLKAVVKLEEKILGTHNALNEVALIPDAIPHMNDFDITIDNQFLCSQHSDGVIIATPTGSTAYALSGGGPILHPQLDALVLVPMFPHTLSMRPIVIEGSSCITIHLSHQNNATPRLTCDGQAYVSTPPGSQIIISKLPKRLHLIHPLDYDYYETLRSKLHWGKKISYSESS